MKIPFTDLKAQHAQIRKQIDSALSRVIKQGDFILGEDVGLFEKEFARFCNANYAVGVSSGTAALFLALLSLGIGKGDEVIVPDFTYIATALAVSYTGARPVFADIDEKTYNIAVDKIAKAVTKNTKAIIPVHLYGQPANMAEILAVAKKNNLKVIEDAAQAHGAMIKMNNIFLPVGAIGDIGCFSFYPTKNLGGIGDGGMVVTNNDKIYKKLLMLRDYGRVSKYEHAIIGYNSRLDTLQAAVLRIKLKKIGTWNKMRQKAALTYNGLFRHMHKVITPYEENFAEHVYHVYAVRVPQRDGVFKRLQERQVGAIIHYPIPLHMQPAYRDLGYRQGDFPVSERIAKEIISLPMFPHLSKKQAKFIVNAVKLALEE